MVMMVGILSNLCHLHVTVSLFNKIYVSCGNVFKYSSKRCNMTSGYLFHVIELVGILSLYFFYK